MTSWSPIYLQALINGQATPNIGELNYLMSLFHKKKFNYADGLVKQGFDKIQSPDY